MDMITLPKGNGAPPPADLVLPADVCALIWHHLLHHEPRRATDEARPRGALHAQVDLRRLTHAFNEAFVAENGWMLCVRALHYEYVLKKRRVVALDATRSLVDRCFGTLRCPFFGSAAGGATVMAACAPSCAHAESI